MENTIPEYVTRTFWLFTLNFEGTVFGEFLVFPEFPLLRQPD